MLNTKSFLSLDLGSGSIKAAEFEVTEAGALLLKQFATESLGAEGLQDETREAAVVQAIKRLVSERGFSVKDANICATGSHVFSKFVKLPPVDTSKVTQIIQYEAQQNVPFPLEEVVWDFQILGTAASGELEVLLVAIKADIVEGMFRTAQNAGLRLQLVDVSPAALCNAFRYSYGDLDGCTMLLDIGARSSNLLFFEKGKVYSRSINIGANSITQDFANESKLGFDEAERVKAQKGFVSLGGAYEEPDDPQAAAISKIARQVMTRLHIQVNQTIQFYRGQQGGSAPVRLFLAGGASIMPYMAQFFADKLNLTVEYFNPFRNVQLGPGVDAHELERQAHCFGEVVGLGLRNLAHCPVELNLMPKSSIQKQAFNRKRPYFVAMVFCLVLVVFAYGLFYKKLADLKQEAVSVFDNKIAPLKSLEAQLKKAQADLHKMKDEADVLAALMESRGRWSDLLAELRRVFIHTERVMAKPGNEAGVWIESMSIQVGELTQAAAGGANPAVAGADAPEPPAASSALRARTTFGAAPATNEITGVKIKCKGVNMNNISPSANTEMAFALAKELQSKDLQVRELEAALKEAQKLPPEEKLALEKQLKELKPGVYFDAEGTQLSDTLAPVEDTALTFSFGVAIKFKNPIKL